MLTKVLEWGRLMAYLEQSTRYIPYDNRLGGRYRYYRDPDILGSALGTRYVGDLDRLFDIYAEALPPMQEWYSGLLPYEYLLPSQIAIIVVMARVCVDFTRGTGFFVTPRRFFAIHWLYFGYFYLAVMVARYPIQMALHPESRWFGGTIPIFFHWVLAAFVIAVGLHHRLRLKSR